MSKLNNRLLNEVDLLLNDNLTIREIAKKCKVSKSTVHKDFREKLPKLNSFKYQEVDKILDKHKQERHIKGGEATKIKYKSD